MFIYLTVWVGILFRHGLVTSCTDHLEKIGSMSNADLPDVDTFCHTIFKILFTTFPPISEKSLDIRKLSSPLWWIQVYQSSNFHLKAWNFITDKNCCLLFLHSLLRKSRPNTQVWITIICLLLILLRKKWCSMKKAGSSVHNSIIIFSYATEVLYSYYFVMQNIFLKCSSVEI